MDIQIHIESVRQALSNKPGVVGIQSPKVDRLSENRANIKVRITFLNGSFLDLREDIDTTKCYPEYLRYGYQYCTSQGVQVFRYDNNPHYPEIQTFPCHKHLGTDDENIAASNRPSYRKIFQEINQYLETEESPS